MALSPLSKSSVASSSFSPRTSAAELSSPVASPTAVTAKNGPGSLQGMFQADGFDAPAGVGRKGALQGGNPMEQLAEMVQMLTQLVQMLGGMNGAGAQQGAAAPGIEGAAGAAQGGVPDLGGDSFGGVPDLGGEGASANTLPPEQDAASAAAPAPAAPQKDAAVAGPQSVGDSSAAKGKNTITLNNDGDKPMTVNFTPNAGEKAIDSVTLKPGESRTVQFPDNWSGNFRTDKGDGKNATLGEVKFDGGFGNTYYDVSYIEGHNTSMTIQPEGGGRLSGTMDNLLASAPDSVKAKGADGSAYGIKKSTTSNVQDPEVVDFFRKHVGADQGYVIPTDDASTLGSKNSNLVVHLKDLA
ncbi:MULTISPECIES: hypothetical protein [unclassified Corallococcus]|uniref:hypothetical protein n=1 Tax=unclassified Corallococcus TaxID=2685029 RepID=UPI001A8CD0E2|nr:MULTISPECIES: hypothetical protein [unclassified Corallococcus]MBN9687510.1 hypothetical protein [Corallococcus sp. NCSPR001]WAS88667.1 hypothetical protein O0N60_17165 [Corallococcus sp. NCRR]